jgi:hypothetical protein
MPQVPAQPDLLVFSLSALVFVGALTLTGCDLFEADEEDPIEGIAIVPDSVSIQVGEQVHFSVVALTASGDTVRDADINTNRWWSTDSTVFTVGEDGLATGQGTGSAFCVVEATVGEDGPQAGKKTAPNQITAPTFTGRDSAFIHLF